MDTELYSGKVDQFNKQKGFGYIKYGNNQRIHVHSTEIQAKGFRTLDPGQSVQFKIGQGSFGPTAKEVRVMVRNEAVKHDTEDKAYWYKLGEEKEEAFVREIVPKINRPLIIHPEKKEKGERSYIDLLNTQNLTVADLKAQNIPFFTVGRYGLSPQFAVTFNRKDYDNYKANYPNAMVYFWVNWQQLEDYGRKVEPMYGVWEVPFEALMRKIEDPIAPPPLHPYVNRMNDPHNARDSYIFDLRTFARLL